MLHQPGCEDKAGCILLDDMVWHFDTKHIRVVESFCNRSKWVRLSTSNTIARDNFGFHCISVCSVAEVEATH